MSITPEHEPAASELQQPEQNPEQLPEAAEIREPALTRTVESGSAKIRRAPKYGPFLIIGGGVAAIVTFILTMSFPVDPAVGVGPLFGYFSLFGIPAGVAAGALVALVLDKRSTRRARAATVEHETVEPEAHEGTLES